MKSSKRRYTARDMISQFGEADWTTMVNIRSPAHWNDFIATLRVEVEAAIALMEGSSNIYQNNDETQLSHHITVMLRQRGYNAVAEADNRGHVDLTVRPANTHSPFRWLAEAKRHKSYEHLEEGLLQLLTRYSSGTNSDPEGGLIVYVFNKKARDVVQAWHQQLDTPDAKAKFALLKLHEPHGLRLKSRHEHETSGMPYLVRHFFAAMYYAPQDKSGRKKKSGGAPSCEESSAEDPAPTEVGGQQPANVSGEL